MSMILVHFDRQMTESEFFDAMSEVYGRNGTDKFFVDGIHSVVARNILEPEIEDDTIWESDRDKFIESITR